MFKLLISLLLLTTLASVVIAQDDELPLACVSEADNLILKAWGYTDITFAISSEHWETLVQLPGESIWIGYPGGWRVPSDIRGAWEIDGDINDNPISIWVWSSEEADSYYMFPFVNTELFADHNGEHYGMHPCGGWIIDKSDFLLTAIEIISVDRK